jgi:hypothetical protein
MIRLKWMLMLAGLLAAIGCDQSRIDRTAGKVTSEDVRRDVGHADKTTAAYAEQTKEGYQQQLDTRLKGMDAEIAMLHEKNRDLKGNAKAEWERTLLELQAKRDSAYARLTEVRQSSGDAWKDVKKGAQLTWDDLDNAFRDASRHF